VEDPTATQAILDVAWEGVPLSSQEIDAIMAFLESLSDPGALEGRMGVPQSVPSGLPVDR
jgi:cytochrome c peroxidase